VLSTECRRPHSSSNKGFLTSSELPRRLQLRQLPSKR